MRVALGADHAGVGLKFLIGEHLRSLGHEVKDLGTHSNEPVDYPDFASAVAGVVSSGVCQRGVVICGSGVGASVAANKHRGIRAGLCHDVYSAHQGVEHDDMNILVLGGRVVGEAVARELVEAFVNARYSGEVRHERRLAKVRALEEVLWR